MSYKIGARKPEAAAFAAAAAALSLPPSACAFVDDLGAHFNDYLTNCDVQTSSRHVFVLHWLGPGINLKAARALGFSTVKMLPK
jgi:FMN phosphatase YigB (HAD superfamily)